MLPQVSPVPQARDANQLDDVDPYLTKKYEEEYKEAERVVRPVERGGNPKSQEGLGLIPQVPHLAWHRSSLGARRQDGSTDSSRGPATLSIGTQTPTTVIKTGLPLLAFQFKGSMLDPLLKELIKLLTQKNNIKSLTVHFLVHVFAFHRRQGNLSQRYKYLIIKL